MSGARVTNAMASSSQILSSAELVLAAVQLAQRRANSSVMASITTYRLATVRTPAIDASY